jgi:hypothetical protein
MSKQKDLGFDPGDMTRRAFAAWYKGGGTHQPTGSASGWEEHDGLHYIVLREGGHLMAVYRIRNDGTLRRMRRWPKAIEATS